jgi:hypothetical protein
LTGSEGRIPGIRHGFCRDFGAETFLPLGNSVAGTVTFTQTSPEGPVVVAS